MNGKHAGYYFAKWVYNGTEHWTWTAYQTGARVVGFTTLGNRDYSSGTDICGGVEPSKAQADYANEECADIH